MYNLPLYSNDTNPNHTDRIRRGKAVFKIISKKMDCMPEKMKHLAQGLETVSPWGLFGVYRAAVTCMELSREAGDLHATEGLIHFKQILSTMRRRWNAAGRPSTLPWQTLAYRSSRGVPSIIRGT
jgi:hypothetical protein